MLEWIIGAAGLGFGIMGIAAYVKTNLEARQDMKNYEKNIAELRETISKGLKIEPRILIEKVKDLIDRAKDEIWILGINALGVFHESFENIIHFMENGGKLRVLLLDPESEAFKQREEKEEGIEKDKSGRLMAEYVTSVAFCRDIVRLSNNDSLELRVYKEEPKVAFLVADPKKDTGMLHINEYPINKYPNTKHIRGYIGEHRYITKELHSDVFEQKLQIYEDLWNNAKGVALLENTKKR